MQINHTNRSACAANLEVKATSFAAKPKRSATSKVGYSLLALLAILGWSIESLTFTSSPQSRTIGGRFRSLRDHIYRTNLTFRFLILSKKTDTSCWRRTGCGMRCHASRQLFLRLMRRTRHSKRMKNPLRWFAASKYFINPTSCQTNQWGDGTRAQEERNLIRLSRGNPSRRTPALNSRWYHRCGDWLV